MMSFHLGVVCVCAFFSLSGARRPSLFKKGMGEAILSVVRDKTGWFLLLFLASLQRRRQQQLRAAIGAPIKSAA